MEFFNSLQQVKANWQPYKKWEAEQDDKEFQRQELYKKVPTSKKELEKASQYGRTLIDSINIMDQYATDKSQDVEMTSKTAISLIIGALSLIGAVAGMFISRNPKVENYLKKIAPENRFVKQQLITLISTMSLPMLFLPFCIAKSASYEKEAARTARYQAREDKLKDPKNFVIYNETQLDKAKEIAKTLPTPAKKEENTLNPISNYSNSIKSVKTIINDHKNYLKWKEESLKKEKTKKDNFDKLDISPEKLQEAKKDQDNLLRTIRKIEINSQNYLSNVEMAFNMALAFDLGFGVLVGIGASGIVKLLQKMKLVSTSSQIGNIMKSTAPGVVPILLSIITIGYATKMEKDAARIGRFKAKQELLKDPHNFITYSDDQLNSVKDLKAPTKPPKGFLGAFKDNVEFFLQLQKDYKEYKKYQETDCLEEQKLQEALMKIDVSDEQLKDAKSFQKNTFMSFEKVDEMSQRYVTDIEAALDIGKNSIVMTTDLIGQIVTTFLMLKPSNSKKELADLVKNIYPMFAPIVLKIPIEVSSTQIQKQANKIGIMEAMESLEDPRYFIQNNSDETKKS